MAQQAKNSAKLPGPNYSVLFHLYEYALLNCCIKYCTSLDHVTMGCGTPEAVHPMTTSSPNFTSSRPSSGIGVTDGGSENFIILV